MKAKQLEAAEKKKEELELALKAAKDETVVAVENAKVDVGRLALAEFRKSEEFVGLFGERYDGGWVTAKRCVSAIPTHHLTGSKWRSILLKGFICALLMASPISASRTLLPTFFPLLEMKKRPLLEDFGCHLPTPL